MDNLFSYLDTPDFEREPVKIYTITLDDGRKITDLTLNGNNFVSQTEITEDIFTGNLKTVTFSSGEREETYHDMELIQIARYDDGWYFILREIPENEKKERQVRSDIDFIAMMTDVELD